MAGLGGASRRSILRSAERVSTDGHPQSFREFSKSHPRVQGCTPPPKRRARGKSHAFADSPGGSWQGLAVPLGEACFAPPSGCLRMDTPNHSASSLRATLGYRDVPRRLSGGREAKVTSFADSPGGSWQDARSRLNTDSNLRAGCAGSRRSAARPCCPWSWCS